MILNVDGVDVFAVTGGRPHVAGQPAVMFVHGAGMDHSIWALPSRWFARHGYNVLALDLPGHGRSEGQPLVSIGEIAAWLGRVQDQAGVGPVGVAGHSMGSLAALEFAAMKPDAVRALTLVGTAFPMPVNEQLLNAAAANDHAAIDMLNIYGHARAALIGGDPHIGGWSLGVGQRLLERSRPGVIHCDLNACNEYVDGLTRAARVRCPALVVAGDSDLMTPLRSARDLIAAIPGARTRVIADCGHSMFSEQPDVLLDALIDGLSVEHAERLA